MRTEITRARYSRIVALSLSHIRLRGTAQWAKSLLFKSLRNHVTHHRKLAESRTKLHNPTLRDETLKLLACFQVACLVLDDVHPLTSAKDGCKLPLFNEVDQAAR
jgi:hypothetical protein